MLPELLATKVGMTRIFDDSGASIPVTILQAGPCTVLQVKTAASDGYEAVQIGLEDVKPHRSTKPMIGHTAKAGTGPKRHIREVRLSAPTDKKPGDVVTVDLFVEPAVKFVDIIGTTKGRGFAGGMKRHGFGGQPASHGTERKHRSPGSLSGHATNRGWSGRIKKGKRMAGQMGNVRTTIRNQRLIRVDAEKGLLLVEGAVPGPNGGVVTVRKAKTKA
jgi:large subunit ribosomal protein L3